MPTVPAPLTLDASTPEALSALLEGRSDAEIERAAIEIGVDALLDRVFDVMVQRFVPGRATGDNASIVWKLTTPSGPRSYQLRVAGGTCGARRGESSGARVVIDANIPVFLRVISGSMNGLNAFASGALRVQGEQVLALAHQLWFEVDRSKARLDISTPSQLATLIRGRSDDEVEAGLSITGTDVAIRQVFEGMVNLYLPHRGPRKRTVITFSVRASDGDRLAQFVADPRGGSYHIGEREPANVTLLLRFITFLRMISGELDGLVALAQRKLKVRGSLLTARSALRWFDLER